MQNLSLKESTRNSLFKLKEKKIRKNLTKPAKKMSTKLFMAQK